jgi:hypothetical protein
VDEVGEAKARVFLSYSRKDQLFVERLGAALAERGFTADWDQAAADPDNVSTGISAQDEWWERLQELIAAADVMVFVVSPDSASSPVCAEEIAYAREIGKRVVPILHRSIDFRTAPPRLAALNVKISFVEAAAYPESLNELIRAISLDVGWMRESTRLTQQALRWESAARDRDLLLAGSALDWADRLVAVRPANAPPISPLVLDLLEASRDVEAERHRIEELQRIRYQEIERVTRELLAEELRVRESQSIPVGSLVADELNTHTELVRSLVSTPTRWHPQPARHLGSSGAMQGYAEYFEFPCCGRRIKDFLATGTEDPPSQLRADGCQEIPPNLRYEPVKPSNPFSSRLVWEYRRLAAAEEEPSH